MTMTLMRLLLVTLLEFTKLCFVTGASQVLLVVKNLPANAEDIRDLGSIPGSGRSPEGVHSSPLQYSGLENPMDRRTWQATVHRVTKSQTWLKWLSTTESALKSEKLMDYELWFLRLLESTFFNPLPFFLIPLNDVWNFFGNKKRSLLSHN